MTKRYIAYTDVSKEAANIEPRFVAANTQALGFHGNTVDDDRNSLHTLANVTMQPNGGEIDVIGGLRIASNLSIPANVRLNFRKGAYLTPDVGVTVTISGTFNNEPRQKFAGGGVVTFGATKPKLRIRPEWWGAKIDNATNDQPAYQAAVNAAVAMAPAEVYSPAGTALLRYTARVNNPSTVNTGDGHAIVIDGSNIVFCGEPGGVSKLKFVDVTGANPAGAYQVVAGQVWRGGGIFIRGGVDVGTTRSKIIIRDLELDGNAAYTGNNTIPAIVGTGDGWDITNKGVWLENDRYIDRVLLDNVHIHNFRGELVYAGANNAQVGRLTGRNLELHDTNGDGWSTTAQVHLTDSEIYTCGNHGIENAVALKKCYLGNLDVHDCALDGIETVGFGALETDNLGQITIEHCRVALCGRHGIAGFTARNWTCRDNIVTDCGHISAGGIGIRLDSITVGGGALLKAQNITVVRNRVVANTQSVNTYGIAFNDTNAKGYTNVVVADNHVVVTALGLTLGKSIQQPFEFTQLIASFPKAVIRNNTANNTANNTQTDTAAAQEVLLPAVLTTVATRRPTLATPALYEVLIYYRVVTGPTNVQCNLNFTDGAGGIGLFTTPFNDVAAAVGSHQKASIIVSAQGPNAIVVQFLASVANQVYASVVIRELPVG